MKRAQGLADGVPFLAGAVTSIVGMVAVLAWLEIDTAAQQSMARQAETTVVCAGFWGCGAPPFESLVILAVLLLTILGILVIEFKTPDWL